MVCVIHSRKLYKIQRTATQCGVPHNLRRLSIVLKNQLLFIVLIKLFTMNEVRTMQYNCIHLILKFFGFENYIHELIVDN